MSSNWKFLWVITVIINSLTACKAPYEKARESFKYGEYQKAIFYLEKAISKDKSGKLTGKANYWLAESYRLSNRPSLAVPYYQQAIKANFFTEDLPLHYGYALKSIGAYEQAKQQFEKASSQLANKEKFNKAQLSIKSIDWILANKTTSLFDSVRIENMTAINTPSSEYGISVWKDKLYFSSTRRKEKTYHANGDGFSDIYEFSPLSSDNNALAEIQILPNQVNLWGIHEACPTLSADGKTLIFARSTAGKKRDTLEEVNLYACYLIDGEWSEPELLSVSNARFWDSSPHLLPDGKTLIFASNRPGGYGGIDLYRATIDANGNWSKPVNMGKYINTAGNELFPYMASNRKLYFASDGHPGYGGLDIFEATRIGDSVAILNIGKPFNTQYDDFGLIFTDFENGYFVSNRPTDGAKGDDDIFRFTIVATPPDTTQPPVAHQVVYYLAGNTLTDFRGGRKGLDSTTVYLLNQNGDTLQTTMSSSEGTFRFQQEIVIGNTYKLIGQKEGYTTATLVYNTSGKQIDTTHLTTARTEIVLDEPELVLSRNVFEELLITGEIVLENIYYDFDDYKIRSDAATELDKLVAFLQTNPTVKVELGSHTDARGSDTYNNRLSSQRAKAAVDYLIAKGITPERLSAKGYGKTKLLIINAQTEEEHQLNRRTTLSLIK